MTNGSMEICYPAPLIIRELPTKLFFPEEREKRFIIEKEISFDKRSRGLQKRMFNIYISELFLDLSDIEKKFGNLTERQSIWTKFKENINSLWDYASDDDISKNILSLLIYSVKNLKAENIEKSQLRGFVRIMEILKSQEISEDHLFEVNDILIKYNIPAVRFPKGAAELCD